MAFFTKSALAAALVLLSITAWAQIDLDTGLVAYYSFDDGTAFDSSASLNHGVLSGNPTSVPGMVGNALAFDGTDDYVTIPAGLNFDGDFTMSFWVKKLDDRTGTFILKGERCPDGNPVYAGTSYAFSFEDKYEGCYTFSDTSTNHFNFQVIEANGNFFDDRVYATTAEPILDTNVYYFFTVCFSNAEKRLAVQINDVSLDSSQVTYFFERGGSDDCTPISPTDFSGAHQTSSSLTMGAAKDYCEGDTLRILSFFRGELDEVRFYDRKLGQEEIDSLANFQGVTRLSAARRTVAIDLFPNPAAGTLTVRTATALRAVALYDLTGRLLPAQITLTPREAEVRSYYRGLAIISVTTDQGVARRKVRLE